MRIGLGRRRFGACAWTLMCAAMGPAVAQNPPAVPAPAAQAPVAPPTTLNGEQAPPLRVPPPPELAPTIVPTLPPGAPTPVPAGPITVDQAVAIGLQNQTAVGIAQQTVVSAAGRVQQARSALLPSLSASAGYTRSDQNSGSGGAGSTATGFVGGFSGGSSFNSFTEAITARQLLFDFGHTAAGLSAARSQEQAAAAGVQQSRQDTAFNIRQAYFTLLEDQHLEDVATQNVDAQRTHLAEAQAQFGAGKASQADVLQAQTSLADALLALANAQNATAIARTNLNLAMGVDPRNPTQAVETVANDTPLPDMNSLVAQGLASRPEMLAAQKQVAAASATVTGARTSNLPAVVATGTMGLRGASFPGDSADRSAGVGVQWDIFDSGFTAGEVKQAQAALNTARLQLTQTRQTVTQDVTQAYLNVANARQRVVTAAAEVANAQESVRVATGRYQAGVGIFLAVIDAQAALATAQANQVDAVYGLQTALAALDRAIGRPV